MNHFHIKEVAAWQGSRNNKNAKVNWRFTTEDARVKLSRLYPTLDIWRDTRDSKDHSAKDHAVGSIIFLDAFPIKPVQLKVDIITPHYGPYYLDDEGKTPPADWHSPIPVPFLAVDSNQEFISVSCREGLIILMTLMTAQKQMND